MNFIADFTVKDIYSVLREDSYLSLMFNMYTELSKFVSGKKVLDFGCGYGWGSYELSATADSVIGYDRDSKRIEAAQKLFFRKNLTFISDLCLAKEKVFDIVVLFFVLSSDTDDTAITGILDSLYSLKRDFISLHIAVKSIYRDRAELLISLLSNTRKLCKVTSFNSLPLRGKERILSYTIEIQ